VYIYIYIQVRHNNNKIHNSKYYKIKSSWLHVSVALQPSSGQLIQIKYLQCAYNMGSHNVYDYDVCVIQTAVKNVYWWIKYIVI